MGWWAEIRDFWNDIKQCDPMKKIGVAILFVGLMALSISVIFYCIDWGRGRHAKLLWGLAECDARPDSIWTTKRDTVSRIIFDTVTLIKHDTLFKPRGLARDDRNHPNMPLQKIDSGSSGLQNNAPNLGQQAGRDINNFGSFPRQLTVQFETQLLSDFPNKNEKIVITCLMGDGESLNFATAIKNFLTSAGYSKIVGVNQAVFGQPVIGQYAKRDSSGAEIIIGSKP